MKKSTFYSILLLAVAANVGSAQAQYTDSTKIIASADAYVYDGSSSKGSNFGSVETLILKGTYASSWNSKTYSSGYDRVVALKFPISTIQPPTGSVISKVVLRLAVWYRQETTSGKVGYRALTPTANPDWSETELTWNNFLDDAFVGVNDTIGRAVNGEEIPLSGVSSSSSAIDLTKTAIVDMDITPYINGLYSSSSLPTNVSLLIDGVNYSGISNLDGHTGFNFISKDATYGNAYKPQLVIYYATESTTPVSLSSLGASVVSDKKIQLNWATYSEINTDHFVIEKASVNGDFVAIGNVTAAGNSSSVLNYDFEDLSPVSGTNSYRIVSVDKDGFTAFSNVASVQYNGVTSYVKVYPNPVKAGNDVILSLEGAAFTQATLIDLSGKIVKTVYIPSGSQSVKLSTANLAKGIYFLTAGNFKQKIVVQ